MANSTVLIMDAGILAAICLLGMLAKLFPKNGRRTGPKH